MDRYIRDYLNEREQVLRARHEAIIAAVDNVDTIDTPIFRLKSVESINKMLEIAIANEDNDTENKIYWLNYTNILKQVKSAIESDSPEKKSECHILLYFVDGQRDAVNFVIECNGNIDAIDSKIKEKQKSITSGRRSMNPTASPRIYLNGLLDELKNIRERLEVKNN